MSQAESEEDLTRKQRREQSRAQRKALEEEAQASVERRKRLTQLGVVVAVVVVAVVVILIATSGGGKGKSNSSPAAPGNKANVEAVEKLLAGIPQSGNALGNPTSPVTLQYFGDLECPICKEFTLGALQTIIPKWVKTGKLRIEYRSLQTATREPEVFHDQQVAALAAGKQGRMWQFVELFYHEQGEEGSGYVTEGYLQGLARQVQGLSLAKWTSDRNEAGLANQVSEDAQAANSAGFNGTPSFLVGRSGGAMKKLEYSSLTDPASFNGAIEKLLKG